MVESYNELRSNMVKAVRHGHASKVKEHRTQSICCFSLRRGNFMGSLRRNLLAATGAVFAMIAVEASATPITWQLENAVLGSGRIGTGSFVFDADTPGVRLAELIFLEP
jgi:hypothetical protein